MDEKDTSTDLQDSGQTGLTRRQFLSYVLGGTGAFMGTLIAAPMVVSAFDPIHRSASGSFSKTNWKPSQFNGQYPLHVKFNQHIDDAWNSQDKANDVYVIKYQNKLMIMSHVCTHLGCHVEGSDQPQPKFMASDVGHNVWFFCPCHGSHYNQYGVNTPSSPAPRPLDLYHYKIESDGTVSVGSTFQRTDATWSVNPNPTVD
ncbi:ubiquinol-cytochrome c reductase iron-sulfur subunit [Alicyclobacillus curvatus]|nr:ubiquinol-cytochrome c reductase iron-sulfur subunit [Alicyclobacillus curvatus]